MKNKVTLFVLILINCLFSPSLSISQELVGKVIGVSDGDNFTLLTKDENLVKIRLSEIDSPERDQPFGNEAKQALSELILAKEVRVVRSGIYKHGGIVAHVYVDGLHVNRALVKDGMAWVYLKHVKDSNLFLDERDARENERGIWSLPKTEQVPPWKWRKKAR